MTFRMKTLGFACVLVIPFTWIYAAEAAETLTPDQIRAAMQSERSKIISGRFVANGRYKFSGDPELDSEGDMSWKYEFDYADDYFLFERNEPRDPRIPVSMLPSVDTTRLKTFFAGDRLATYAYQDRFKHDSALKVYDRNDSERKPDKSPFKPFNVRGIGFHNYPGILKISEKGDQLFFEHPYVTKRGSEIRVSQETANILKLCYKDPDVPEGPGADNSCLWVDKSRGFIPIRSASITNGELDLESRTEWKLIDQIWVPTRLTGNSRVPFIPRGKAEIEANLEYRLSEFELDLTWESLNENVGTGKIHDLRNFDLPEGTRAFKGKDLVHIYGIELPVRNPPEEPKVVSQNKSRLPVYLGSLLLLVISITIWRRRRVKNG